MAHKILLTSLHEAEKDTPIRYYYSQEGGRCFFCDALLTVEASTKYILANYDIDEIVVIGRHLTFDEGDEDRQIELKEGSSFYTSDISDLSTYSLFRYRIAQYIDELRIEQQDTMDLLSTEEQDKVRAYIDDFFKSIEDRGKFNRLFENLAKDRDLYRSFANGVRDIAASAADSHRFMTWIKGYLYENLKDSGKLEILPGNEDVMVRFIPTSLSDEGRLPVYNIYQLKKAITENADDSIDIFVALNNDDMTDNYVLINILDIVDTIHEDRVNVNKIFTTSHAVNGLAGEIRDDTLGYGITELAAATRAFLKYGKVDMILDYWEKNGPHNELIEQMIYAMKRIDVGLSLCNIREMETGINRLKQLFIESDKMPEPEDYHCKLFMMLADGIRKDYGALMEGDDISFIDLVKWAFSKKFYQQTLTLIESRAPEQFAEKGIYYYCNSEERRDHIVMLLAQARNEMKPYEYWKMDNSVDHFFLKTYERRANPKGAPGEDPQRSYAKQRIRSLDNTDDDIITAFTACDDRELLENILYAYYHVGYIRNLTNHAEDKAGEDTRLIVDEKDESIRLVKISEAIEYFIRCFEAAVKNIGDQELSVFRISTDEVKDAVRAMERAERDDRTDRRDRTDRIDRGDRADRGDRGERGDRAD